MGKGETFSSVTFRMSDEDISYFQSLAKSRGISASDVYREACLEYRMNHDSKICPECKEVNASAANFCHKCGAPLAPDSDEIYKEFEELKKKYPKQFETALKNLQTH